MKNRNAELNINSGKIGKRFNQKYFCGAQIIFLE